MIENQVPKRVLLSGNEAIAQGAWEAGVCVASGYPGTPSTEILETLSKYTDVYAEWAPNEKVALEMASGASLTGARAMVTMKHVGLNVAADPLLNMGYIGAVGGLVIVVADDPGIHSSQNEQDSRHYARMAKIPILEPGSPAEARLFIIEAFDLSEKYGTPVILRTTTCVSHSRALVPLGERIPSTLPIEFKKNPKQFVLVPAHAQMRRVALEERLHKLKLAANVSRLHSLINGDPNLCIISSGVTALHCQEIFKDATILKLGMTYPFPDDVIRNFSSLCTQRMVVIEEGDNILEEHVKSLGIQCDGKNIVPTIGELTPDKIYAVKCEIDGVPNQLPQPCLDVKSLPGRPPVFCPGCPHRAVFYALSKLDVVVSGDIGCYSLGTLKPLDRLDTLICMGAGISALHGMEKTGAQQRRVGIVGDSTFFHSGITALIDIVYNKGNSTVIVVDNRITAMTGHQDHPGSGRTLMGDVAPLLSIEDIARACGIQRVFVVNPYDIDALEALLRTETETQEPSLIISRAPCPLNIKKNLGEILHISDNCKKCRACLKLGCPAIACEDPEHAPHILSFMCNGCGLCKQVCKFGCIQ